MRSVVAHGVLAVGGLVLAWLVWVTPEEERSPHEVELVDCSPEDLTSIVLDVDRREVKLERRGEGDEAAFWVTVTRRPEAREGEEPPEPSVEEFVAGRKKVEEYLPKIAPLRALRALGELDEETAEEVSLDEDQAGRFVYTCGDQESAYAVGETAFGTGDRYLREADGNVAYLLAADAIREIQSAEALLMQRDLHEFEWKDVEGLTLKIEDRERRLLQRNRRDPERAEWVDAEDPDRRNELYGNWLDRMNQLRVQNYLDLDAEPGSDIEGESAPTTTVLTIDYYDGDGDEIGHLELARVDANPPRYYARSTATRAWVNVPRSIAQQVEDDARTVVGLEPLPRPEPAQPTPEPTPASTPDAGTATPTEPTPTKRPPRNPNLPPGHP